MDNHPLSSLFMQMNNPKSVLLTPKKAQGIMKGNPYNQNSIQTATPFTKFQQGLSPLGTPPNKDTHSQNKDAFAFKVSYDEQPVNNQFDQLPLLDLLESKQSSHIKNITKTLILLSDKESNKFLDYDCTNNLNQPRSPLIENSGYNFKLSIGQDFQSNIQDNNFSQKQETNYEKNNTENNTENKQNQHTININIQQPPQIINNISLQILLQQPNQQNNQDHNNGKEKKSENINEFQTKSNKEQDNLIDSSNLQSLAKQIDENESKQQEQLLQQQKQELHKQTLLQQQLDRIEQIQQKREQSNEDESIECKPCRCKKQQCLKLYCDCFKMGIKCGPLCECRDCCNNDQNQEKLDQVRIKILKQNPDAFSSKKTESKIHRNGCNCKNSQCQKKYCECFAMGIECGQYCQCVNCKNDHKHSDPCLDLQILTDRNNQIMNSKQKRKQISIVNDRTVIKKKRLIESLMLDETNKKVKQV